MSVRTLLKQLRGSPESDALKQQATKHLRGILGNLVQKTKLAKLAEQNPTNGTARAAPQPAAYAAYTGYPALPMPAAYPYQPPNLNLLGGSYQPYIGPYAGPQVTNILSQRSAGFIVPQPPPTPYQPGSNNR